MVSAILQYVVLGIGAYYMDATIHQLWEAATFEPFIAVSAILTYVRCYTERHRIEEPQDRQAFLQACARGLNA